MCRRLDLARIAPSSTLHSATSRTDSLKSVRKDVLHLIQFLTCQRFRCLRTRCFRLPASTSHQCLPTPALRPSLTYSQPSAPHRSSSLAPVTPFQLLSPRSVSVGLSGLEPLTPALSAQCSNLLSYRPFLCRIPGALTPRALHPAVRIPASNAHSSSSPRRPLDLPGSVRLHALNQPFKPSPATTKTNVQRHINR